MMLQKCANFLIESVNNRCSCTKDRLISPPKIKDTCIKYSKVCTSNRSPSNLNNNTLNANKSFLIFIRDML